MQNTKWGDIQNIPDCAAIYTAVVVARSTGPNRPNCEFRVLRLPGENGQRRRTWTLARTDIGCFTMTTHRLILLSSPSSFWRNNKWLSSPHPPYSPYLAHCDFFLFPKMKLKLKGRRFDTTEIQAESQSAWHCDRKGLPGSVPKLEETVGPVSTLELLRGWWRRLGLMVSFMVFTVSVRNILHTPSLTSLYSLLCCDSYYPFNAEWLIKTSRSKNMREKPTNTPIIHSVY
jgi:hypothetical protein